MPANEKEPEERSPKKRKPREIRWTPTTKQDELIHDLQQRNADLGLRSTRAQIVQYMMHLGWTQYEHRWRKEESTKPVPEEAVEQDNLTDQQRMDALLARIKAKLPEIEKLLKRVHGHWGEEDSIYRFYHHSLKTFWAQKVIKQGYNILKELGEGKQLNRWYEQIYKEGMAFQFDMDRSNPNWLAETRPILEAFWHTKYFLEMMVKYGKELDEAPQALPSGWASVLYLYRLR
jgi:hypothetical protein